MSLVSSTIRCGLLQGGYRKTDIGDVPLEWRVVSVGCVASIKTGSRNTQDRQAEGHYPFFVRSATVERINTYCFDGEAVLTAGDGVGTGKVFHYIVGKFDCHQRVYMLTEFSPEVFGRYFYYVFRTRFYKRISAMTAKSSVDSVRMEMIADMRIPLPPLPEQCAIAEALGDVDDLISAQGKLIAKKRAIKAATTRRLLTGKQRLSGFGDKCGYKRTDIGTIPDDWEVVGLEQVGWFQEGPGLRNWQFTKAGMKVLNVTNLVGGVLDLSRTDRHISEDEFRRTYSHFSVDAGDFVMASSGNSYCKTAIVRECDLPLMMNTSVIRFKATDPNDSDFFKQFLASPYFKLQIDLMITGGAQPNFGPFHLRRVKLGLPAPAEQRAIAEVLTDMDSEITALEKRLAKTKDIKQGMMQELLTGRTRLV